jgi:hypothetical protein
MENFESELAALLNKYNKESVSNTPDSVLAIYIEGSLRAFNAAVNLRTQWYSEEGFPPNNPNV